MSHPILYNKNIKNRVNLKKSFLLSTLIHIFLIFGVSFVFIYKQPFFDSSPVVNIKLANADIDQDPAPTMAAQDIARQVLTTHFDDDEDTLTPTIAEHLRLVDAVPSLLQDVLSAQDGAVSGARRAARAAGSRERHREGRRAPALSPTGRRRRPP